MGFVCTLLAGALCLTGPRGNAEVSFSEGGLFGFATIESTGWRADEMIHTDNIRELNPAKLTRLCANAGCIDYFRHCEQAVGKVNCVYIVKNLLSVTVIADSAAAQADAEERLAVVSYGGLTVPLSALAVNSPDKDPYCTYRHGADGRRLSDCPLPAGSIKSEPR